jgi:ZIP family zinc transporter
VGAAFLWGFIGASSLILGGVVAMTVKIRSKTLGLVMAFGSGVLVSAVAYELVLDAFTITEDGGRWVALGLLAGALTFYAGDAVVDRWVGASASGRRWRRPAPAWPSCSASCSTAFRSRSCSG